MSPKRPGKRAGEYLVPGARAVAEVISAAPGRVRRVMVPTGHEGDDIVVQAKALGLPVEALDRSQWREATRGTDAPRQVRTTVLAVCEPPAEVELEDLIGAVKGGAGPLVALDEVVDPHNLGAILRSAEFFGVAGVVWARDRSASLGPGVARASAGASERLSLGRVTNLDRALRTCQNEGLWVLGTVPQGGTPLPDLVRSGLPDALVIVLGGEHKGLRRLTRERCDYLATIESRGRIGSLNVSAAAAITFAYLTTKPD